MTKAEIIEEIVAKTGIARKDASASVEAFMEIIKDSLLEKKENVYLRGFGSFIDKASALHIGLLPQVPIERISHVGNAAGAYFMNDLEAQRPLAQEGIRWLVCVMPAILMAAATAVIVRYPLTDEMVDRMNREVKAGA